MTEKRIECSTCDGMGEMMDEDYNFHDCITCDTRGYLFEEEEDE